MRKLLFLLVCLFLVLGCTTQRRFVTKQGIMGEVRWVEGNLMPTIGDSTYSVRAKGKPVIRTIYIFEATRRSEAISAGGSFYKLIKTKLIARVKSNKQGKFKVDLPPGNFSLFVMEKDGYYANTFDGDNYINPVTVQANKFTEIQILVNYKAYY